MVPLPTDQTYEGFEDLIDRTNVWLKEQTDILVTNFQSVIVQKNSGMSQSTTYSRRPTCNAMQRSKLFAEFSQPRISGKTSDISA